VSLDWLIQHPWVRTASAGLYHALYSGLAFSDRLFFLPAHPAL
jgi:hypothetical protein